MAHLWKSTYEIVLKFCIRFTAIWNMRRGFYSRKTQLRLRVMNRRCVAAQPVP